MAAKSEADAFEIAFRAGFSPGVSQWIVACVPLPDGCPGFAEWCRGVDGERVADERSQDDICVRIARSLWRFGTSSDKLFTVLSAVNEALFDPRRDDVDINFFSEAYSRSDRFENPQYQRLLLRRLGFGDGLETAQWLKAARSVGFDFEQFTGLDMLDLCIVLEAKADALDKIELAYCPHDALYFCLRDEVRVNGGRPRGLSINGEALKRLRIEAGLKQDALADLSHVSPDSIQRAESGVASPRMMALICEGLGRALSREIDLSYLTK